MTNNKGNCAAIPYFLMMNYARLLLILRELKHRRIKKYIFDVGCLVIDNILTKYPTDIIEQSIAFESRLVEDLQLTPEQVYMLGLLIEGDLQAMGITGFSDKQILCWKTVQDIVDTIKSLPGVEHKNLLQ